MFESMEANFGTMESKLETRLYTAEDVLAMDGDFELDHGVLVPVTAGGWEHSVLCSETSRYLGNYVREHRLGQVGGNDPGFVLEREPDTMRGPDVAFVSSDRLPSGSSSGYYDGPPDLAIEVVGLLGSVNQTIRKCTEYMAAGARLAWVFDIKRKRVIVITDDNLYTTLSVGDVLDGGAVVPGFRWPVADIFA